MHERTTRMAPVLASQMNLISSGEDFGIGDDVLVSVVYLNSSWTVPGPTSTFSRSLLRAICKLLLRASSSRSQIVREGLRHPGQHLGLIYVQMFQMDNFLVLAHDLYSKLPKQSSPLLKPHLTTKFQHQYRISAENPDSLVTIQSPKM